MICPIMSAPGLLDAKHLGGDIGTVSHYNNTIVFQPCVGSECALWESHARWDSEGRYLTREGVTEGRCGMANSNTHPFPDPALKEATE